MLNPISKTMNWDPHFYRHFPGYESIISFWKPFAMDFQDWPSDVDYNDMAMQSGFFLRFVLQQRQMVYIEEIHHSRTIPMRPNLWHDFFNNLSWLVFPKLKWAIVQRYYQENTNRSFRTSRQNLLTQLDECGMIFCSDKTDLFADIHEMKWSELFADRTRLLNHGLPIIVGHGIMEKALSPYIGMTAKALFLQVPRSFFGLSSAQQLAYVDEQIAQYIMDDDFPAFPKSLAPFPVLGWPGWYLENENPSFYDNSDYFRTRVQQDFTMQFRKSTEEAPVYQIDSLEPIEERALKVELQLTDTKIINEALEIREQAFSKVKEGSYQEALEILLKGLEIFPNNFSLQTLFAAVLGDYSCNFFEPKKEIMTKRSKEIFDALMLDVEHQPKKSAYVFKNEYYYRFKMFREQYDNGVKRIEDYWNSNEWLSDKGFWGYYNQGVGAANFAKQLLMEGNKSLATDYAQKAIIAWSQFFSYDNTYYNSYVHYAMALGILGHKGEMMKAIKRGMDLIKQDLNHPEFKEVIDFIEKYGCVAEASESFLGSNKRQIFGS